MKAFSRICAIVASIVVLGALTGPLAGCGQTGPLYLPQVPPRPVPPSTPEPTPSAAPVAPHAASAAMPLE